MLANLFEVFNVRDPRRRLEAIERNYTEDVTWSDPDGSTEGHEAMNEQAQKLLDRMPGFVFSAAGPVHVSGDLGLLGFRHRRGHDLRCTMVSLTREDGARKDILELCTHNP